VQKVEETPKKNKGGRPKIVIDYAMVEKFASMQCTYKEIACFFECSEDRLKKDEEFIHHYKKAFESGKMSLRRIQWKLAERNTAMAIWLGKQYLDQRDRQEIETNQNIKVDNPYKNLTEEELKKLAGG
jgi:hypothetical protein